MCSAKICFDNTSIVNFLSSKFVPQLGMCDAEITEWPFAASQVRDDAEDMNCKLYETILPFRGAIVKPLPDENKIYILILP